MLTWGLWPVEQSTRILEISPAQMNVPGDGTAAVLETRRLSLFIPQWVRAGEAAPARLTFEALRSSSNLPGKAEAALDYTVFVETHLDLPGIVVEPAGTAGQPLPTGRTVVFWWELTGVETGEFEGTAWLSLRFESQAGGKPFEQALAAPRVRVEVHRLLGMDGVTTRWAGSALAVLAVIGTLWRWKYA